MENLVETFKENSYPGRGIIIGKKNPSHMRILYFIMGRSTNSRNRIFAFDDDGIRTEAFDPSKLTDPSLIIYHPVRFYNGYIIVTNGDQTDTVRDHLMLGHTFSEALNTREFEPDAPNFTPRISLLVHPDLSFELSILRSFNSGKKCTRMYWHYEDVYDGTAFFISTYKHDGNPLPSFDTPPRNVVLPDPDELWQALDRDNKVSLYSLDITVEGNKRTMTQTIYNVNKGD
ncbi:MAG: inosine monophosphate cyclohydrolase [Oscillospiraceae bacterium]|nr:inosine monophosphate cyclohydrolase [Oscillospiraceae bacterium]